VIQYDREKRAVDSRGLAEFIVGEQDPTSPGNIAGLAVKKADPCASGRIVAGRRAILVWDQSA